MTQNLSLRATALTSMLYGHDQLRTSSFIGETYRLFSALIHVAAQGDHAEHDDDGTRLSQASDQALRWLEQHPPHELMIHETSMNSSIKGYKARPAKERDITNKGAELAFGDGYSPHGDFGWAWDNVPDEIAEHLKNLAQNISYLGTSESLVKITPAKIEPTHYLDETKSLFDTCDIRIKTPTLGRLDELTNAYAHGKPAGLTTSCVTNYGYTKIKPDFPNIPWNRGLAFPVHFPVHPHERVKLSHAIHKALISIIGDGCPSIISGIYPDGVKRQPNNIAIHYLHGALQNEALQNGCILIAIPPMDEDTYNILYQGCLSLKNFTWYGRRRHLENVIEVNTHQLWNEPLPGMKRTWTFAPGYVSDLNVYSSPHDAVLTSIGYVWRDILNIDLHKTFGSTRAKILQDAASDHATVLDMDIIADSHVERYVHKYSMSKVIEPLNGHISFGDLLPDTAFCALGQSRHFGGGLCVPEDIDL